MLTLGTRIRVVAFAVLAVVIMAFTGLHYANLGRLVGLSGYYNVRVYLANAGGLYTSADVTYRGVSVGRVASMGLTSNGIVADLHINNSAPKIPSTGLQATVADLSAVGEEYLNLRPQTNNGPYLTAGDEIKQRETTLPLPVTSLLNSFNDLVTSVPQQSLRVVVAELGTAFQGEGQNLQTLLDSSSTLTKAATEDIPESTKLIDDGRVVLRTQADESAEIESWAHSASLLAGTLASSDTDLNNLIVAAPQAALQVTGLLKDNSVGLGALIANLLTTSEVSLTREKALQELLSSFPAAVAAGSTVITSSGANFGLALTFFNPLPCTSGYGATMYRNGLTTSPAPPLNTAASCTSAPSSGIDVRGSANAPAAAPLPSPATAPAGGPAAARGHTTARVSSATTVPAGTTDMSQLLGLP